MDRFSLKSFKYQHYLGVIGPFQRNLIGPNLKGILTFPEKIEFPLLQFPYLIPFVCLVICASIFLLIYKKFKLPLPPKTFVEDIFGPEQVFGDNNIHNEGACQCHAYPTERKGFKRTSLVKRCEGISPLQPKIEFHHSIIGHRGVGMNSPENSLGAIRKCYSRGCTMVEFDVSLTKDCVPVLFHDDNLLRITGVDKRISEITWEELRQIDVLDGERVPQLKEAVELCLALGMRFIIDIKDVNDKLVDSILTIFKEHGQKAYSKGVVSSFYFQVIYKIRSRDPNIVGCMAWRPHYFALPHSPTSSNFLAKFSRKLGWAVMYKLNDFAIKHLYWRVLGLSAVLVHKDALNMELIHNLRLKGLRIYAWTVNCPTEKRYFLHKLQIGYLTDTLEIDNVLPAPELWLCNNNEN